MMTVLSRVDVVVVVAVVTVPVPVFDTIMMSS